MQDVLDADVLIYAANEDHLLGWRDGAHSIPLVFLAAGASPGRSMLLTSSS